MQTRGYVNAFIKYFSKLIRQIKGNLFIYFLTETDAFEQSYCLQTNQNVHLTIDEPIKISVTKVKIKLKFVAKASERRAGKSCSSNYEMFELRNVQNVRSQFGPNFKLRSLCKVKMNVTVVDRS